MQNTIVGSSRRLSVLFLIVFLVAAVGVGPGPWSMARAQGDGGPTIQPTPSINPADPLVDEQIEQAWHPTYLNLATGDPNLLTEHGVYTWPFALDSIGWSMQSYQDYGGTPYFHHGMDMMKMWGTMVFNRSGGQVINIENYNPGWDLYWEVAILDPDGYIWQYHHIQMETIPQLIWDKFEEWQADPIYGGFIPADTHIGNIIEWPVWSFGKQFNHIHLNILAAGGVFVNGFEFHNALPDTVGPEIQHVGLLQYGQIYPGDTIEGAYSLYVRARDLILDDVYYLPPWEITFAMDCGPVQTTWRFDTLPGGWSDTAYLDDFYVVPPTCGDYDCRDYYIDLGFIRDSQFEFPTSGGQHTVLVTVRDYAGNTASQSYTYTVIGPPNQAPVADPQSVSTPENIPVDILLTGSDPDNDPLSFSIVSTPTHGTLGGIAPNLVYTPAVDYIGDDSFTFVVSDCLESSEPAMVDIEVGIVNHAPTAEAQSVSTDEDTPLDIVLTGSDPDGDVLTFTVVSTPANGILGGVAPNLTYTPTANYNGQDSFTFVVNDGQVNSDPAVVHIDVTPVNDAPVADPQSVTTRQYMPVAITLSGSDIEGHLLIYSVITPPEHGTLSGTAQYLIYTPAPGYAGVDSFSFVVNDGELDSLAATVSITINYVVYGSVIFK
jgi:Bacterial Ig domain